MPEISGPGQKKLLESNAFIYGETVKDISVLVYYLAALGIGKISCYCENESGYEKLFYNIKDLNTDILIELINKESLFKKEDLVQNNNSKSIFRVFLGNCAFIKRISDSLINTENESRFLPTIIALKNQWKGILQTFHRYDEFKSFIDILVDKSSSHKVDTDEIISKDFDESKIITSILGTLVSIEGTKICLNLGEVYKESLYFDFFSMEFSKVEYSKINFSIDKFLEDNYNDTVSDYGVEKDLSKCKVLIVGTGGLGSPVAFALSMVGVGTIGLVDHDRVEISNLNRQIIHSTSRIGMAKVESAKAFLKSTNPNVEIVTHDVVFNKSNAMEIISNYDIIIDGVDNFPTRYLLNDACLFLKKTMIEAGVLRFTGLNTTIIPGEGHCYRCAFPSKPKVGSTPSCSEAGVLGSLPGVMGFIQAAEAIKLAIGKGNILKNKLLYFDALDLEFTMINLNKNKSCALCGENPSISELEEYEFICESKND